MTLPRKNFTIHCVIILILFFFLNIRYICADIPEKSNDDKVAVVEKFLNDIKTLEADFIQIGQNGEISNGHFFLKRPDKLKMVCGSHVIIVVGNKMIYYDRELKERTETTTYSSPLSFLLEKTVDLQKKLKVVSIQNSEDSIAIKLCRKEEESEGAVTLVFSRNPLLLRKWILWPRKKEKHSSVGTEISLLNWKYNHRISDEKFRKFN